MKTLQSRIHLNFISPRIVQQTKLCTRLAIPFLLHQALSKALVRISEQLTTRIKLANGIPTKTSSIFKVASLASHGIIIGMPFPAEHDPLIDPVS